MTTFRSTVPYLAAGGLLLIDARFIIAFALSGLVASATPLELALFVLQIAKTATVLGLRPLRMASPAILVDLYGADLFLLPALLAAIPLVGVPFATAASYDVIRGWTAGVAFAGLPYAAFRLGRGMLRSSSLAATVPAGIIASELSILMANATLGAAAAKTGLTGVVDSFLRGSGTIPLADPVALGGMAVVYASLLAYAVLGLEVPRAIDGNRGLLAGLLSTAAAAALALGTSRLPFPPALLFIPPTLAMAAATWWFARGR